MLSYHYHYYYYYIIIIMKFKLYYYGNKIHQKVSTTFYGHTLIFTYLSLFIN